LERVVYLPILCRRAGSIRTSAGHPANLNSPLRGSTIASSLTGSNRRSRATQVKRNYERWTRWSIERSDRGSSKV